MNIQKLFSRLQPNSQTPETPQIDHLLLINKISNLQEIVSQQESTILELQQEIKILKSQKSLAPSRAKSISVSEILNSNSNSNSEIVISRPISRSRVPNLPRATFDFSEIQRTLSEAEEVIQGSVERKGKEVEREKQVIQQAKTAQCRKPEMAKNAEFSAVKAQGVPEKPVKTLKKPVPKQQVCSSSGISQGYDKDGVMTFKIKIDDFEQIRKQK
ncbi:hypothetical protein SS50377_26484 [Spironucleus salmonicida]|uniref:Uncharacterized protein n=1 Tax=Spironucleus salmonicida TaxID=348837 RepID=V6LA87_9EUKA|nr:hypothetical protein SS50377_26484 [Spironucleus salmonicida]|eukprot:EST41340.1 Hypothetical protein SS50377_19053 [Spironucleus salmonicida]